MDAINVLPNKHVIFTDFDGDEGILVDLNTKKYYQLNQTAMLVWKALESGKSITEIAEAVTSEYEVSIDHAIRSVERLLTNFQ